jgi:AsmA protein
MRWILRAVYFIIFLLVVFVGALFLLPGEKIAKLAFDQVEAATGRTIKTEGDVSLSFYPVVGVKTQKITIANADWSENGPMVQADGVHIGVGVMGLLSSKINITSFQIDKPEILLEISKDGSANWEFSTAEATAEPKTSKEAGGLPQISFDKARISDAKFTFWDHKAGTKQEITGLNLDLSWPDMAGPLHVIAALGLNGTPIKADVTLADALGLGEGKASGVEAKINVAGADFTFDGNASSTPAVQGALTANIPSVKGLTSALGLGAVELPKGLGMDNADAIGLGNIVLGLDHNKIAGALKISLKGKPNITGALKSDNFDLSALTSGGGTEGDTSAGWSKAAIDASGLHAADANIDLAFGALNLGMTTFQNINAKLTLNEGRAVANITNMRAFDGGVSGEFVVNARGGLSVGGTLNGKDLAMKSLLGDTTGITRFSGPAAANVKFVASGPSVHHIMNSLDGNLSLELGKGRIEGIDLDKLMRSGDTSPGTTVFDSMKATANIANGVVSNDDLLIVLSSLNGLGAGKIDLGGQALDYVFTPKLTAAREGKGIAIPVRIKGPWAKPQIIPDLEALVNQNLAEEKKKLEEKAKAAVEEQKKKAKEKLKAEADKAAKKIEKKTGVKLDTNNLNEQSAKDAIKKTLEQEAIKGLQNLLKK